MNSNKTLIEVSEFVANHAKKEKVAVIFDLDSTLFCVAPRTQAILRKLGNQKEFSESYAEVSQILRDVVVLPTDWGVQAVMQRHQVSGDMDLFRVIRNFWRKHFFANHFLDRDTIYPSANEYVNHLHSLGADILYLTGRGEGSMRDGTIKMLQRWGFPYFSDSNLFMKPSEAQTDEGFKAKVLEQLIHQYDHIWFFENEPVIIAQVRALVPKVHVVFVNSVHSGQAVSPTDLRTIGMNYEIPDILSKKP